MPLLIIWLLFGVGCAIVASNKSRSVVGWFCLGSLLGPFGLLYILLLRPVSEPSESSPSISSWGWGFTAAVILLFFIMAYFAFVPDKPQPIMPRQPTAAQPQPSPELLKERKEADLKIRQEQEAKLEQEAAALGLRWEYEERSEKMGRGTVKLATVRSLNEVEFDFPYRGLQRATLQLRLHPRYGKDVTIAIEKGQFLCGFRNCQLSVRFDDGKAQNFSAVEPADHSTSMLFIRGYDRFLASARKAKKVYIEALFYQQGTRVFEFDISGLKW
jgi:hypothetical protein